MRFRNIYMGIGSILVLLIWVLTDPQLGFVQNMSFGASTIATVVLLLKTVLYAGVLHVTRKALMDYLDLEAFFKKAIQSPEGAGSATIAVALIYIAIAITIYAAVN